MDSGGRPKAWRPDLLRQAEIDSYGPTKARRLARRRRRDATEAWLRAHTGQRREATKAKQQTNYIVVEIREAIADPNPLQSLDMWWPKDPHDSRCEEDAECCRLQCFLPSFLGHQEFWHTACEKVQAVEPNVSSLECEKLQAVAPQVGDGHHQLLPQSQRMREEPGVATCAEPAHRKCEEGQALEPKVISLDCEKLQAVEPSAGNVHHQLQSQSQSVREGIAMASGVVSGAEPAHRECEKVQAVEPNVVRLDCEKLQAVAPKVGYSHHQLQPQSQRVREESAVASDAEPAHRACEKVQAVVPNVISSDCEKLQAVVKKAVQGDLDTALFEQLYEAPSSDEELEARDTLDVASGAEPAHRACEEGQAVEPKVISLDCEKLQAVAPRDGSMYHQLQSQSQRVRDELAVASGAEPDHRACDKVQAVEPNDISLDHQKLQTGAPKYEYSHHQLQPISQRVREEPATALGAEPAHQACEKVQAVEPNVNSLDCEKVHAGAPKVGNAHHQLHPQSQRVREEPFVGHCRLRLRRPTPWPSREPSLASSEGATEQLANDGQADVPHPTEQLQLPLGWESAVDASSGNTYYFNRVAEVTQWEHPGEAARLADVLAQLEALEYQLHR
ncbi:unnamed protein product [Prorocentrum cordatum]|uniref:WW domain-containing protein n=1 Tax=Prorocentrum cordatum TaxID=2364126 RepID=A0ABN9X5S7_9DINO|nr:unnamed protein product [Polarella glacialis]